MTKLFALFREKNLWNPNRYSRSFYTWIRNQCRQIETHTKKYTKSSVKVTVLLQPFRLSHWVKVFRSWTEMKQVEKISLSWQQKPVQRSDKDRDCIIKHTHSVKRLLSMNKKGESSWSFNQSDYKSISFRLSWLEMVIVMRIYLQNGAVCMQYVSMHNISSFQRCSSDVTVYQCCLKLNLSH